MVQGLRFSGRAAKVMLLLVATGVILLAAEIAVRIWFRADFDSGEIRKRNAKASYMEGFGRPATNPDRVFEMIPGIFESWGSVILACHETESRRIATFARPPQSPAVRIALVGDSSSMGFGVYYEASYGAILENRLAATFDVPVELRTYGLPGYNAAMNRAVVENDVAAWKPDLLVLHCDHNDADPPVSSGVFTDLNAEYGDNPLHSALIKFVVRRVRTAWTKASFHIMERRDGAESEKVDDYRFKGPRYRNHLDEFRKIGESVARQKLPAVAVIFDGVIRRHENPLDDPHYTKLHAPLNDVLRGAGFSVLDLYSRYQKLMKEHGWEDLQLFAVGGADIIHPNEAGHFFIAEQVHKHIVGDPELSALFRRPELRRMTEAERARVMAMDNYQAGIRLLHAGQFGEAEAYLREGVRFNPSDPGVRILFGFSLMFQEKTGEAIAAFQEALRLGPNLTYVHFPLGDCFFRQGEFIQAVDHLGTVVRRSTNPKVVRAAALSYGKACEAAAKALAATDRDGAVEVLAGGIENCRKVGADEVAAELEKMRASLQGG